MMLETFGRRGALLLALLLLAGGCGPGGPLQVALRTDVRRPARSAVLFICDGVSADQVEEGCRDGWLPNIQNRFVESGTCVRHATCGVPSITYSVLTTLATGVGPATHGVVGNRWFDRRERILRDYAFIEHYRDVNHDFWAPTIYERIRPAVSASIQSPLIRGLTQNFANWAVSGTMWFFRDYTAVDKLTATTIEQVSSWANTEGRWPALLTCYFPGPDSVGHEYGPLSPQYRAAIVHVDYQIGRVCDWLESQRLLEATYLVLVADHGMVSNHHGDEAFVDVMRLVRAEWGRKPTDLPLQEDPFTHRRRYFDRFDTVVIHGMRLAALHLPGPTGWDEIPDAESVQQLLEDPPGGRHLWELPGVDLVAYAASDDEVVLRSPRGSAQILECDREGGRQYKYAPEPDDVFGYMADPDLAQFVEAGFHDSRDWLRATAGQTYPDVVPHLGALLRTPRGGQALAFAARGYSFQRERGGHGGLLREEVRIPMMFSGPGIAAGGTIEVGRAVDLVPTLMALLGLKLPGDGSLEGMALLKSPG